MHLCVYVFRHVCIFMYVYFCIAVLIFQMRTCKFPVARLKALAAADTYELNVLEGLASKYPD